MSSVARALLVDAVQGYSLLSSLWKIVKPLLANGKRYWIEVREEARTTPQNAKFHAICGDLAKSQMTWGGKRRNTAQWKVLLVSGHAVATKIGAEMLPGIEGEYVNLRESTALMSISRGSSLIEYAIAFCVMNDVPMSDPDEWIRIGLSQGSGA